MDNHIQERDVAETARQDAKREAEYQKNMTAMIDDIELLERKAAGETNIEKLREVEQQLEASRKKKREAEAAKKEADLEKKRIAEEKAREKELAQELALINWEYEHGKVQVSNEAGVASAKNSQKAMRVEQGVSSLKLALMAAEYTAEALGGAHWKWPAVAAATAGSIAVWSKPSPPDFIPAPLPLRPFALGGIVKPRLGGTAMSLNGLPSLVGEVGYPEMVLPLNQPNIDSFLTPFKGSLKGVETVLNYQGTTVINVYNPTNAGQLVAELEANFDRDIADMVNKANKRYSL